MDTNMDHSPLNPVRVDKTPRYLFQHYNDSVLSSVLGIVVAPYKSAATMKRADTHMRRSAQELVRRPVSFVDVGELEGAEEGREEEGRSDSKPLSPTAHEFHPRLPEILYQTPTPSSSSAWTEGSFPSPTAAEFYPRPRTLNAIDIDLSTPTSPGPIHIASSLRIPPTRRPTVVKLVATRVSARTQGRLSTIREYVSPPPPPALWGAPPPVPVRRRPSLDAGDGGLPLGGEGVRRRRRRGDGETDGGGGDTRLGDVVELDGFTALTGEEEEWYLLICRGLLHEGPGPGREGRRRQGGRDRSGGVDQRGEERAMGRKRRSARGRG